MTLVALVQWVALGALGVGVLSWARHWPYPSPLIRPLLPARQRWPEGQIRAMLAAGVLHPGYLAFFNRDPARFPDDSDDLLAPADGLLTSADVHDGIRYIVIALSFWDVHVQRSPAAGRIGSIERLGTAYRDGEGRDFVFLSDKRCPVQVRIVLDTSPGDHCAIRLITSLAARRIAVWHVVGDTLTRGARLGRIRLGSTVVLEVPADRPCEIAPGTRVRAGETRLVRGPAREAG